MSSPHSSISLISSKFLIRFHFSPIQRVFRSIFVMDLMDSSFFPSFSSSSSSSTSQGKYDVFLSFRGEDTRYNFVGHLYEALIQKGIHTFRDDEELNKGKAIRPELLEAINESKFAVVIISKDYASSVWCLDELAHIIVCKEDKGMTVLPVFHYVDPSDVRKQMGTFADAFVKHEEHSRENKERIAKWRDALMQVGNLAGWHLNNTRSEIEDIKDIVGKISLNLKYDAFPYITKDLVGIYSRMMELESCLAIGSNNVRIIGIWAMGGMGKTTLARVVYHMVSKKFEAHGFIEDVKKKFENNGCVPLQQKLLDVILKDKDLKIEDESDGVLKIKSRLSRKKILLVLDDVDKLDQLKMLVGEPNWFGPGSRIIITTRDAHVLKAHRVDEIYEVKGLNDEDALQLFCSKAFEKEHVLDDYLELSNFCLNYAGGLPLALEVLGSFLFGKSIVEWKILIERLKEFPEEEIFRVLEISFNGLQKSQKEIFLHIACFFNHENKNYIVEKLDILGLFPSIGLKELVDKSLLKITNDIVWMHDLLEEMGRNIVCQECPGDPRKRSRLWHYEDIDRVLTKNKGTEVVQAMDIWGSCNEEKEACWNLESFSKMYNLKFLRIYGLSNVPTHLPDGLKILEWSRFPSKSLPSSFQLDGLIQLCLEKSDIERLWIGRKNFEKLKFIQLKHSNKLSVTPDFTGVPNLEKLIIVHCTNLRELHPSIGILKKLILLDLSHCIKLEKIPEFVRNMESLQKLNLDHTAIMELPSSVGGLIGLTSLSLRDCKNIVFLPSTICNLKSLECLDLFGCSNYEKLPETLGNVEGLKKLDLSGTAIKELPESIERLKSLTSLTILECNKLVCLPNTVCGFKFRGALNLSTCFGFKKLPENLWIIEDLKMLDLSRSAIEELPSSIERLTNLTILRLRYCLNLVCLPSTICSLKSLEFLDLFGCSKFDNLPKNLGNVEGLKKLDLSGTAIKDLPSSIERLTNLTSLNLLRCYKLECLPNTTCGLKLCGALDLSTCFGFKKLPENLWIIEDLEMLDLSGTAIEELPSSIERLTNLTILRLRYCLNLVCLPSTICSLKSLEFLDLFGCSKFDNLPKNLGNVEGLKKLDLSGTAIKDLPSSIERLTNLTSLTLLKCYKLECLPNTTCGLKLCGALNLSSCFGFKKLPENLRIIEGLGMLDLSGTAIEELPSSIERLTNLTILRLRYCLNLVRLPSSICSLKLLNSLDLFGCLKFDNLPENIGNIKCLELLNLCWTGIKVVPSSIVLLKNLRQLHIRGWTLSECYFLPTSLESMDPLWTSMSTSLAEIIVLPSFLYYSLTTSPIPVGLLLPSLLGLQSLTHLHVIDCNLSSIPNDIDCLSSLESLDLSGNNFVSLPESMSQLSNLRKLFLEGCKRLQSLENVPSTIDYVIANNCTSLERLPTLQNHPLRLCRSGLCFQCFNCFKLNDNIQSANNMLQGQSGRLPDRLEITLPGSEIPKWFSHYCTGHELNIRVPSYGCNVLTGIVLCVVFVPNEGHKCPSDWVLSCLFNGFSIKCQSNIDFRTKYGTVESHHLWQLYLSDSHLSHHFSSIWGSRSSHIDANGFLQLRIELGSWSFEIEKIGVHLVYKQDMKDPNHTMAQCSNNSTLYDDMAQCSNNSTLYDDLGVIHHDIDDSTTEGSRNKRSCNEDDGEGPSGESYYNEEPLPKRIQRLTGFMAYSEDSMEGEDQTPKKLEAIHGGNSYQEIEDLN